MNEKNPGRPPEFQFGTELEKLKKLFSPILEVFKVILESLISIVFVINLRGAIVRRWILIVGGGILWAWASWRVLPGGTGADSLLTLILFPFRALLTTEVFFDVLLGAAAFWLAIRIAAVYLDDVFELDDVSVAESFIRQAAFASKYDVIEIRDGKVAEKYEKSPVFLIGGPGRVVVYLENAALFEKINGEPNVIGPTIQERGDKEQSDKKEKSLLAKLIRQGDVTHVPPANKGELEGFERLREVIDLRDQVGHLERNPGRTRDGIKIHAIDLRFVFSVFREGRKPTLKRPLPFNKKSIEQIVYDQTTQNWKEMMEVLIRKDLGDFVAGRSLDEFLASIGSPEIEQGEMEKYEMNRRTQSLARLDPGDPFEEEGSDLPQLEPTEDRVEGDEMELEEEPSDHDIPEDEESDGYPFIHRPHLTGLFYDEVPPKATRTLLSDFAFDFKKRAAERGVELSWIDVGTWKMPDEIIPEQHKEAWRLTRENYFRGNKAALNGFFNGRKIGELIGLIQEVPLSSFQSLGNPDEDPLRAMRDLGSVYLDQIRTAMELYERKEMTYKLEYQRLRLVAEHLARVIYRWPSQSVKDDEGDADGDE